MRIKKDPITKNQYIQANGLWVRNFAMEAVKPKDLNRLFSEDEIKLAYRNEISNQTLGHTNIADEDIVFEKVVIISDGYDFDKRHHMLSQLPEDVSIIAVNKALAKWRIDPTERPINVYLTNNPYAECLTYINKQYYPSCVASTRTNPDFIRNYKGNLYFYQPAPSPNFGTIDSQKYYIDDYRNPICAAIGLAYRFKAKQVLLMCCDDSFLQERHHSVRLENGLWTYPQHLHSQALIDANLYWLTHQEGFEVEVADYSSGAKYRHAAYIKNEEDTLNFFTNANIEAGGDSGSSRHSVK